MLLALVASLAVAGAQPFFNCPATSSVATYTSNTVSLMYIYNQWGLVSGPSTNTNIYLGTPYSAYNSAANSIYSLCAQVQQ